MPRSSPYVITLTPKERRVLKARARQYTLSYRDVVRAKIVLLAAEGLENKEIAAGLEDRSRIGRPSVFSPSRGRRGESAGV